MTSKSQKFFYKVISGDWEINLKSFCPEEAALIGLKKAIEKNKLNTQLSFIISVEEMNTEYSEIFLFETSMILADLGYLKLSKDLSNLSDFFLDKGKNPH